MLNFQSCSKFNILSFTANHPDSLPHFPHGVFHFLVPEGVNKRIEQGRQDGVNYGRHFVKGEGRWGPGVHKHAGDEEQNHDSHVRPAGGESLPLPFRTTGSQRAQDDTVGDKQQREDDDAEQPTVGDHQKARDVGVSAGKLQ